MSRGKVALNTWPNYSEEYNTYMLSAKTVLRLIPAAVLIVTCALSTGACNKARDASFIGTFHMGEKVQIGPMVYQVLESEWRTELGGGGRTPRDRYLFLRMSITNNGGSTAAVSTMTLEGAGKTYAEVTEDMDKVDNWLGLLRNVRGSQTEQGWIVFDAPIAAYKLVITHGDIGDEKSAHVEIPVQLE
jgi:hypothetical protein